MNTKPLLLIGAGLLASVVAAYTQNFSIDWHTIDGGGGTSTGGVYSVGGTIGQPDAGGMSGGVYTVMGGFWGILTAVQTPGAPVLSIERVGGGVRVFWPSSASGWVLDQSTALSNSPPQTLWSPVPMPYTTNATDISVTVPMPAGRKFYRLRQ